MSFEKDRVVSIYIYHVVNFSALAVFLKAQATSCSVLQCLFRVLQYPSELFIDPEFLLACSFLTKDGNGE